MGVYIKGMEMPDNCYVCPFMFHQRRATEVWCTAIENHWLDLREVLSCDRHNDCPLVPVPPHGRLIDADALLEEFALPDNLLDPEKVLMHITGVRATIQTSPTVIPAEEGE